nr:MAG TPA: hypothetical protein [Bacteriophage sp.]
MAYRNDAMTFHLQLSISLYFFLINPHTTLHLSVW